MRPWRRSNVSTASSIRRRRPRLGALAVFIANLKVGGSFSPELRVHKLANTEIWSLTWAKDGRALFRYGDRVATGGAHIVWEAIGAHAEVYNFKD